ncbi:ANKHD1 [Symbiodinium sp. CCMP2592]|nr:ANKHD1 [Symbiodinium sp. CCMP2592]
MECCRGGKRLTPLEQQIRALNLEDGGINDSTLGATMQFPMYVVSVQQLLKMTEVRPHEILKDDGIAIEYEESMGEAAFISHEWVGDWHPDPEFKQLRVLQDALKYMMFDLQQIPADVFTEVHCKKKPISTSAFRTQALCVWYDYFCCPQLGRQPSLSSSDGDLSMAVTSIPAYVAKCSYFFALCPVIVSEELGKVFSPQTWAQRGWCRMERTFHDLSKNDGWFMIKSGAEIELVASFGGTVGGAPGSGRFTVSSDRKTLAPVLSRAVKCKLLSLLTSFKLQEYRVLLNMQEILMKDLPAQDLAEPRPGFVSAKGLDDESVAVSAFMYQNGFELVQEVDDAGWSPLHYAALAGKTLVVQGLLAQRASPDCQTQHEQPRVGIAPGTTALSISVFAHHNDVAKLLIAAKAAVSAGLAPPLHFAAHANNSEGIRILLDAGSDPCTRDFLGLHALAAGCSFGSLDAIDELISRARSSIQPSDLSTGLSFALVAYGGTVDVVQRMLDLRADVNHSWSVPLVPSSVYEVVQAISTLEHQLGSDTLWTRFQFHAPLHLQRSLSYLCDCTYDCLTPCRVKHNCRA